MAFNAQWELEQLAQQIGKDLLALLVEFKSDLADMINNCPVFRLAVSNSGNTFLLLEKNNRVYKPPKTAGLYAIFTLGAVIYFGEATDLYRRQLTDPDNTADSGKRFSYQGRAILKFILYKQWSDVLGLEPLFMQLYPGDYRLSRQGQQTFDNYYKVSKYSKSLEGAMGLFIQQYHQLMVARAKRDGWVREQASAA